MLRRHSVACLLGSFLAVPVLASAQVCTGFASFANGPYQVFANAGFNDNSKAFGGGFAVGGMGAFGQASIATISFDDFDGSAFNIGVGGGYQVTLDQGKIVHLCPVASLGFVSGPNDIDVFGDGSLVLDLSETDVVLGLSVGALASRSAQTSIIPTASLAFASATLKVSDDVSGDSESESETFGLLRLGVGFVFNQVFTFRPGVSIPLGLEDAATTFGLALSVNFGRSSLR